jgi:predicted metalloprotease
MKRQPKTSAEFQRFEDALRAAVSVSRDEIQRREEDYQRERAEQKGARTRKTRGKGQRQ